MTHHPLYEKVKRAFITRYQHPPERIIRAPGRVNLIGEHTDYNEGFVLPMAVDRAAWVAVAAQEKPWATVRALDMRNDEVIFAVDHVPASAGGWSDYAKGIVWAFLERNWKLVGMEAILASNVPVGAGMSSSAAVELAFAHAWAQLGGIETKPSELALLCQQAENQYVGVNCGIMDQMISACGKKGQAMMLDTRTLERGYFSIPKGVAIMIADSLTRRSLSNSAYNVRRAQCEQAVHGLREHLPNIQALRDVSLQDLQHWGKYLSEEILMRARHVITENKRVLQVAKSLHGGDLESVGKLMFEGHLSLRDDFQVSIPELDTLVEAAMEVEGCYGARLTGAGFGGCIVALVNEDAVAETKAHVGKVYSHHFDKKPQFYITHPADGVKQVE